MNKMFKFNGMPYKRSGRAGGKSVSMIGMLVLLMAALLVLPSCFDDDEVEVEVPGPTVYVCSDGTEVDDSANCPPDPGPPPMAMCEEGTADDDTLTGSSFDDYICGGDGDDTISGGDGDDMISGGAGVDTLNGEAGGDTLMGDAGNDVLSGGAGVDTLEGGEGDDLLEGGPGADTIDGGAGSDTSSYASSGEGVQIDLSDPADIASHGDAFRDTLISIENLRGSAHVDRLTGDGGDNTLEGGAGADMLDGGAGSDTASYAGSVDTADPPNAVEVQVNLAAVTAAGGHAEGDVLASSEMDHDDDSETPDIAVSSIENLTGSAANDTLEGDHRANVLSGGGGVDNIVGNAGDDTINGGDGDDTPLTGGDGDDTINGGDGNDTNVTGDAGDDTINGGDGDDNLAGGAGDDTITGGAGDDTINGGEGNDMIYAGAGDTVDGGIGPAIADDTTTLDVDETNPDSGNDTVSYAMQGDTDAEMEGNQGVTIEIGGSGPDSVQNVQLVIGSPGDDMITGSTVRDFIMGGDGDDMLIAAGNDLGANGADGFQTSIAAGKALADVLAGLGGDDALTGADGNVEVFAVHIDAGDDTIETFALTEDHLHFLGFAAADVNCDRERGSTTAVVCTAGSQTVKIETTGTFTTDLDDDLNLVVDPNG